ncbi:GIY-YIG nuclease family protein [Limosilactobacillus vaginalis]|uniref:GIY-YIG nuclease family protein n=1 Tax=Limosilactobacillus vaginalis TaxID=1633 RepID=UPI0024BAB714|nr:GIY-YIG nuclease family protein [Limosilactobacillus vaginalis]
MNNQTIHSLEDVFNDPAANELLAPKSKPKTVNSNPEVEHFKEIQEWIKQHGGKEPEKTRDMSRMAERQMANRLKGYRSHEDMIELLKPYDELGLLNQESQKLTLEDEVKKEKHDFDSLDDILGDDSVLFSDSQQTVNSKLFDTKKLHEIKREQENQPGKVSQRHHMADFNKYEPLFKKVQAELAFGKRQLRPFKNYEISLHHFYVLRGQLLYIEAVGDRKKINNKSQRKTDARLHVIYENGTENTPLLNGLAASMYGRNGKIVTEPDDNFKLSDDDQITGYIYVLKSESDNPEIRRVQEEHSLYKVGYTKGSVEKRIANAENESTYLYGPVKICEEIQVANLNSEALETAIHHALANYRLDVDIKAPNGRIIHPREWFVTDLDIINDTVNAIVAKLKMNQ